MLIIGGDKSDKQPRETENNTKFYELREEAFKVHNNYFKMVSKAVYDAKRKRTQIFNPKQIRPRLLIALAQVKTCNTSENLLYEIRKIIYFLNREKKVT